MLLYKHRSNRLLSEILDATSPDANGVDIKGELGHLMLVLILQQMN